MERPGHDASRKPKREEVIFAERMDRPTAGRVLLEDTKTVWEVDGVACLEACREPLVLAAPGISARSDRRLSTFCTETSDGEEAMGVVGF